ncbi:MAG: MFS transporter [Hyphomonadaceae bacterium]|jgi:MFS family permease|nr:MFS transporter [Hyphomonadaceae bacterium]
MPPAPHPADERSPRYPGWRVVGGCFAMALICWGFGFYGHAFYLAELQRLHGWPTSIISSATTAYYLVSAVLVVFISDAIRRLGARLCVLIGTASFAASVAALPFVGAPVQLFAVYLVMALGWATMGVGAITNILGLWFDAKRGLAISLALNGASFSGVIIVPGLVFLAGFAGFTTAMLAGAASILLLMVPLAIKVLGPPAPREPASATAHVGATITGQGEWTRAKALRSPRLWSVSAPFALALLSQAGFLVHLIAFLEPATGRSTAGIAVAITTAMAIVGRLVLGTIADRTNQRLASALSLASQAAALTVMTQTVDTHTLLVACAVYGFSVGNLITFPSLIIQREFDAASFGLLIGLSTAITQFTYAFGPGLLGLVRDVSGSYTASVLLCALLNLIAAAIVVRPPRSA